MSSVNVRRLVEESGFGNLLNICLELHMSNTGSSDALNGDQRSFLINILKQAIADWTEGSGKDKKFDNAVLYLIQTTLEECSLH